MVIKVISTPNREATCWKCKSVLSYKYSDLRQERFSDYGGGSELCKGFNCPVCKTFVTAK